jgi:flavin reductase (DIM6/NTAB) family NADH-FMN oxidoreductase RutF
VPGIRRCCPYTTSVDVTDAVGEPDVAAKSWISMVAFSGPVLGFGCNVDHLTYRNIKATGEFVVSIPDLTLAATIWGLIDTQGAERISHSGLRLAPASVVGALLILDCHASGVPPPPQRGVRQW